MAFTDPSWDGITIADLPVKTFLRFSNRRSDLRIQVGNYSTYLVHITRLEPRLLDVFRVFMSQNPIELFAISQGVLDEMYVFAYPEIDAFLSNDI